MGCDKYSTMELEQEIPFKMDEYSKKILEDVIKENLWTNYKAVYLYPDKDFPIMEHGDWTIITPDNLPAKTRNALKSPRIHFECKDLRMMYGLDEKPSRPFDLAMVDDDFATRGLTYCYANHYLRTGGLLLLRNRKQEFFMLEELLKRYKSDKYPSELLILPVQDHLRSWSDQHELFMQQYPKNYTIIHDHPTPSYTVLKKESDDLQAENQYRAWLAKELKRIDGEWSMAHGMPNSGST